MVLGQVGSNLQFGCCESQTLVFTLTWSQWTLQGLHLAGGPFSARLTEFHFPGDPQRAGGWVGANNTGFGLCYGPQLWLHPLQRRLLGSRYGHSGEGTFPEPVKRWGVCIFRGVGRTKALLRGVSLQVWMSSKEKPRPEADWE